MESFQIDTKITLEESLKGILMGQISHMENQMKSHEDVHKAIHETRRTIKRIRALLRLIRDEIGYGNYYRENRFYRDISRIMSEVRDSYVLLQTLELIQTEHPDALPADDFLNLKKLLSSRVDADLSVFMQSGGFEQVLEDLILARERIAGVCQLRNGFVSIRKGIRRVYRRGLRKLIRVKDQYHLDEFHEYRKNTKYLQYHMELIQPVFPELLKAYAGTIDKLAEKLGDIRDYDRFELYLQHTMPQEITVSGEKKLIDLIGESRNQLMEKIFSRSDLIYAEKPAVFTRRIKTYWHHHSMG